MNGQPAGWIFGLLLMLLGGWLLWRMKFTYILVLGSAGGETHALVSKDRNAIQPIADAVTKAIISRG